MIEQFLDKLLESLKKPLPGKKAHIQMIPKGREYVEPESNYIESAVNIILYQDKNSVCFLLTKRNKNMLNHAGQISLPGGKKDEKENDLWITAKRETFEETGIYIDNDCFVGKLSKIFIPTTNFCIQPYISYLSKKPVFPNKTEEVDKFFSVKTEDFFSEKNISTKIIKHKNRFIEIPYFKLENEFVWGATAMILSEFRQITK